MKKIFSGILLTFLLVCVVAFAFNIQSVKASGTVYIRADGSVDPSDAPISTIDNITYIFTDSISNSDGIVIQRNNIIVDGNGYTLQGTEVFPYKGISLSGVNNVTIKDLNIDNFYYAIYLTSTVHNVVSGNNLTNNIYGIYLDASSENTISENIIIGTQNFGIYLDNSSNNNSISDNNITESGYGLFLKNSSNNMLRTNRMTNNTYYSFYIEGSDLSTFLNDIDSSNIINEKPIYYWVNKTGMTIPSDAGYVALVNCEEITVANLNLTENFEGILLAYSTNTTVINNKIAETNYPAIRLIGSSNNNISKNNLSDCGLVGIVLQDSSFNKICSNEFIRTSYHFLIAFQLEESSSNNISGNVIGGFAVGAGFFIIGSENNTILANSVELEGDGFWLTNSSYNSVSGNIVTKEHTNATHPLNRYNGVCLTKNSSYNTISGNDIANKEYGIHLFNSTNNSIVGNSISNSTIYGMWLESSENNKIYYNTISKCAMQVNATAGYANTWDNGYPSGGNCWGDYNGEDEFSGPYQNETGSDGIGDISYVINDLNIDNYPLMDPLKLETSAYDIGVSRLRLSKIIIDQGYGTNITVRVKNYGYFTENFNLTISANTAIIQTLNITLASGNFTTITFTWDTTDFAYGNYTISAYAEPVEGEADTKDNTFVDGWIIVTILGDVNGDFKVDGKDIAIIAKAYDTRPGDLKWDSRADINGDLKVDGKDIAIAAKYYDTHYP